MHHTLPLIITAAAKIGARAIRVIIKRAENSL